MDFEKTKVSLEKAQEKLEKKIALLAKYEAKAEKQRNAIIAKGWDPDDRYARRDMADYNDSYWAVCDYSGTLESIRSTKDAIEDQRGVVARWEEKLQKAKAESNTMNEMPEVLITVKDNIAAEWLRFDLQRQEFLRKEYKELDYKPFIKKHKYSAYQFMRKPVDELKKENEKSAKNLVLNLWNRVREITGPVTDTAGLHITSANEYEGIAINGLVEGEQGKAEVESILAGGYNIQKLHIRTLVHKCA